MELCLEMLKENPTWECTTEIYDKYMYLPTCFYPFQEIFDSDCICSTGLLLLINKSFLVGRLIGLVPTFYDSEKPLHQSIISFTDAPIDHMRTQFVAQYLIIQCRIERASSVEELCTILRMAVNWFSLENMRQFLFMEKVMVKFLLSKIRNKNWHFIGETSKFENN